jgi:hypothetical protein
MRELVGLKIDVGLDGITGHAKYPDFNKITPATRKGMDWSKYIDVHGSGMHYDKTCGHQDDGDTPYGHQCCCICVPADFAAEALALFPDVVSPCSDEEFEVFHDTKAHAHEPEQKIDTDVLNGLAAQRSLMVALEKTPEDEAAIAVLDTKIAKALDPEDDTELGVRTNANKTWKQVSMKRGITVKKAATI